MSDRIKQIPELSNTTPACEAIIPIINEALESNRTFSNFLTYTYEQHQERFNLLNANRTLGHAAIIYYILKDSLVPLEYQASLQQFLSQLLPLENGATRSDDFVYSFRAGVDKANFHQYLNIIQQIVKNPALKNLFLHILLENGANWLVIATDTRLIKPCATNDASLKNEYYQWMINKILAYEQEADNLGVTPSIAFIRFIVACKIYLERIHHQIDSLPELANHSAKKLDDILTSLIATPATRVALHNSSSMNDLMSQDYFISPNTGKEIIAHFMQPVQIKTSMSNSTISYEGCYKSPAFVKQILNSLNKSDKYQSTFNTNMYHNLTPKEWIRPLYIKNLIHTLREQGAIINSIFDPLSYWGGIILGAAIDTNIHFIKHNNPNPQFNSPNQAMETFLLKNSALHLNLQIKLEQKNISLPSHDSDQLVDMICTSLPSFDSEQYKGLRGNDQVKVKASYKQWQSTFVFPFIQNSASHLKAKGIFAVHILKDSSSNKPLSDFLTLINLSGLFASSYRIAPFCNKKNETTHFFYIFNRTGEQLKLYRTIPKHIATQSSKSEDEQKAAQAMIQLFNSSSSLSSMSSLEEAPSAAVSPTKKRSYHTFFSEKGCSSSTSSIELNNPSTTLVTDAKMNSKR